MYFIYKFTIRKWRLSENIDLSIAQVKLNVKIHKYLFYIVLVTL